MSQTCVEIIWESSWSCKRQNSRCTFLILFQILFIVQIGFEETLLMNSKKEQSPLNFHQNIIKNWISPYRFKIRKEKKQLMSKKKERWSASKGFQFLCQKALKWASCKYFWNITSHLYIYIYIYIVSFASFIFQQQLSGSKDCSDLFQGVWLTSKSDAKFSHYSWPTIRYLYGNIFDFKMEYLSSLLLEVN